MSKIIFCALFTLCATEKPNIVFVLFDDLGFADVSWTNDNAKTTPFMAEMAKNGTILTNSYATHRCTPSRAGFLTGRYAFRYGLGSEPLDIAAPTGMSLEEKERDKKYGTKLYSVGL